jgi:PAS domain S-box-containing protein
VNVLPADPSRTFQPDDFDIGRLFYVVRDAVIVANARTERIVLWNDCATQLFGYSVEEALELPLHALVPENLRTAHRNGLARYQETGHGSLIDNSPPVELVGRRKDGSEVPIELTLTPIELQDAEGSRFALAIVRDASERKSAEEARLHLREAELRQKQALELNDTVVQGLAVAQMALEMGEEPTGLEAVQQTLNRAKQIVADLMADLRGEGIVPGDLVRDEPASMDPPEKSGG